MSATIRLATPRRRRGHPRDLCADRPRHGHLVRSRAAHSCGDASTNYADASHLPWLVCDRQGEILGYVYASAHRARAAYQWSVDVTVYIHRRGTADWHRPGVVYRTLCTPGPAGVFPVLCRHHLAQSRQYWAARIPAAFRPLGSIGRVGYKLGAWHDVGWWQRGLQPGQRPPFRRRPLRYSSIPPVCRTLASSREGAPAGVSRITVCQLKTAECF